MNNYRKLRSGAEEHEKPIIDPSRHTNEFQGRRNRGEVWGQGGTQIFELPEEKTSPSTGFLFLCAPPLFGPFAGTEFEYVLVEFAGISIPTQIL